MVLYPEGKISYDKAGSHLVIAAEPFHPVPLDYHSELCRRLNRLSGMKVQMDGAPADAPEAESFSPDCIENTVKMFMAGRKFEPLAMASPRRVSLAGLLNGFKMPVHLLEVYLAIRPFEKRGYPLKLGVEMLMVDRILKEEKMGVFHYIDPERGAHNYRRVAAGLEGGRSAMHTFFEACDNYVNAVWQYGIICPDVAEFAKNTEGSVGVLVEPAHAGAVARVLEGREAPKPDKWHDYLSEERETAPTPLIGFHQIEAVNEVSRLAEPDPKIGMATKLGRKLSRGFTTWLSR